MRITRNLQYEYIVGFTTMGLSDSSIVSRRDSRGKTQLFGALREGQEVCADISMNETERYDMVSFSPPNASRADRQISPSHAPAARHGLPFRDG